MRMAVIVWSVLVTMGLASLVCTASAATASTSLVPLPAEVQVRDGKLSLDKGVIVDAADGDAQAAAAWLSTALVEHGVVVKQSASAQGKQTIGVRVEFAPTHSTPSSLPGAYQIEIDTQTVRIHGDAVGQFYAVQTLLQWMEKNGQAVWWPAVHIQDAPRFAWRGLHLDVGRHLMPISFIKKLLDQMAYYKLNTFHWHLTEDQGWRLEIKRYPKLTDVGAWRKETVVDRNFKPYVGDGQRYGGFYTQDDVREVVAYAKARHIEVVPEIEMPGHSLAAIAAYPELACTQGPFEVGTTWGVIDDILCPKESTFTFLENVLKEVFELFPSEYVHIGGDEAPKIRWQQSDVAQAVIRREGLKDEHELQSWFIRRIEKFLNANGKRLIGWDEILEGGLAPNATVMSWRGEAGGIAAAQQGHDVIMSPTGCCYFDHGQGPKSQEEWGLGGELPIEKVYAYNPVPAELKPEQQRFIRGVQANLWTEYLNTPEKVEYMAFPRLLALAEVAWTPQARRDYGDFSQRLRGQYPALQRAGLHFRIPAPDGLRSQWIVDADHVELPLVSPVPGARVFHSLDALPPDRDAAASPPRLRVALPDEMPRIVMTQTELADGRRSLVQRVRVQRRSPLPAHAEPAGLQAGLRAMRFEGLFSDMAEVPTKAPLESRTVQKWAPTQFGIKQTFALRYHGWIKIASDGMWRFATRADDRSRLLIDGETVVENETYNQRIEGLLPLKAGLHRFELVFYQRYGGVGLDVWFAPGEAPLQVLAPEQLLTEP